jgi:hypothetical protein
MRQRGEQPTVEALVIALMMIVSDEFSDGVPQVSLTENHELVQTLALDRQREPLGVCVQVRAASWQPDALDTGATKQSRNSRVKSGSRSWII